MTKPLVLLISEKQCFDAALDLLEHLHGDLSLKPFVLPYFNPITPLVLNKTTSDNVFSAIEHGLPFIYNNYGMSGATSPITAAGNLAPDDVGKMADPGKSRRRRSSTATYLQPVGWPECTGRSWGVDIQGRKLYS